MAGLTRLGNGARWMRLWELLMGLFLKMAESIRDSGNGIYQNGTSHVLPLPLYCSTARYYVHSLLTLVGTAPSVTGVLVWEDYLMVQYILICQLRPTTPTSRMVG
jgi:hypothetical protein